jgi:hypothetical protein
LKKLVSVISACLLLGLGVRASAQSKHTLVIPLNPAPTDLTVTRDTIIEFQSKISEDGGKHLYFIKCRDQVREINSFSGKVILHWDPAKELGDYFPISVWTGSLGQGILINRIRVHVVDTPPVMFVPLSNSEGIVGSVEISVKSSQPGEAVPPVDLSLDKEILNLTTDATGKVLWNSSTVSTGPHMIDGVAHLPNGSIFSLEPFTVKVLSPFRVSIYAPNETLDLSKINGEIPIRAFLLPGLNVKTVTYMLDGAPLGLRSSAPLNQFMWNPSGLPSGKHRLKLKITDVDGKIIQSPETIFSVVPRPRIDGLFITEAMRPSGTIVPEPHEAINQIAHVVVPQTADALFQSVTLAVALDNGQKPRWVTFYRDGQPIPADPETPVTVQWDPRGEQPGDYSFRADVMTDDGKTLYASAVTIHIPVRIALVPVPVPVLVTEKAHTLVIKANITAGLQPTQVDFLVDGAPLASRKTAPFDTIETDTTGVETGPHRLQLQVKDQQGAVYTSQWVPFTVDNAPLVGRRKHDDEEAKQQAVEGQKYEHSVALFKERKALAGAALNPRAQRTGQLGTVYGLTVVIGTLTNRLTGESRVASVTGSTDIVTGTLQTGTGQVMLHNQASTDTIFAAQTAAEFCRQKVAQLGYKVNWGIIDMHVEMRTNLPVGGPSAGAAYAAALVSSALKIPIDSSVAITGELGANGQVMAVGGVIFKGDAALSNPNIHTLIVPADWVSQADLDALYRANSSLFTNKRIIYAHNMEEVLRQSLIGYDKRYDQAEALIQDALRAFINAEFDKALLEFSQARSLTPENVTILAWIDVVKAMRMKH